MEEIKEQKRRRKKIKRAIFYGPRAPGKPKTHSKSKEEWPKPFTKQEKNLTQTASISLPRMTAASSMAQKLPPSKEEFKQAITIKTIQITTRCFSPHVWLVQTPQGKRNAGLLWSIQKSDGCKVEKREKNERPGQTVRYSVR